MDRPTTAMVAACLGLGLVSSEPLGTPSAHAAPAPQTTPEHRPPSNPGSLWPFYGPDAPTPDEPPPDDPPADGPPQPEPLPVAASKHRTFNLGVNLSPFSGLVALGDPRSGRGFTPLLARLGLGVSFAFEVHPLIDVEVGLDGGIGFGSSALDNLNQVFNSKELRFNSGTLITGNIGAHAAALMDWVGLGLTYEHRIDSVSITTIGQPVETFDRNGGALGVSIFGGFGLRSTELRLLGELTFYTRAAYADELAFRLGLRVDVGVVCIRGYFDSHFSVAGPGIPYSRRTALASVGFQSTY